MFDFNNLCFRVKKSRSPENKLYPIVAMLWSVGVSNAVDQATHPIESATNSGILGPHNTVHEEQHVHKCRSLDHVLMASLDIVESVTCFPCFCLVIGMDPRIGLRIFDAKLSTRASDACSQYEACDASREGCGNHVREVALQVEVSHVFAIFQL